MVLELSWGVERSQWEALFTQAGRSPLLQGWAWGEAKRAEGWIARRGIVSESGRRLGLVQVLEKRLGGLVRVARLNRGPVWLEPVAPGIQAETLRLIGRSWRWWRGGVLFLAPEIAEDEAGILAPLSLRKRKAPHWGSAWIDLSQPPEALRKRLDGKWRNMLVGAEKAGLTVEVSSDLDWLMTRYEDLMADKSFTGTPPRLIRALAAESQVLRALTPEGEAVAGILLVRHGASATYLVGWSGDTGRKLKANNILLWHAMLSLKDQGCLWLDLGGIDDQLTPGIATFKRGMKGEEYRLAGEYLKL